MTMSVSEADSEVLPRSRAASVRAPAAETVPHALYAIEADGPEDRRSLADAAYRALEIVLALVALVVTMPIMLLQAAIIAVDSPGKVLFFHQRCGRSRRVRGSELIGRTDLAPAPGTQFEPDKYYWVPTTFSLVKFRTMYVDAAQRHPDLYRIHYESHQHFRASFHKRDNDPRVTRVGKWLRRLTIDELPNFWNVVTGHVALVGPRPEGPYFVPYYGAEEMKKFTVHPGLTGLAVIHGRSELNIGDTLDWDLKYVRERTIWMDFKIMAITAWLMVVRRRGAF